MAGFGKASIRNKLLLLLAAALLPALLIIVHSGLEKRQQAVAEAHRDAVFLVDTLTDRQNLLEESLRTLFLTLAQLPKVKNLDGEACSLYFHNLLGELPQLVNIALFAPDGEMVASGRRIQPFNNAHSRQFRQAVNTGRIAAGEYQMGRIHGQSSFQFAYPVNDQDGRLLGVLQAGFQLDIFTDLFRRAELPPQTVLAILDHQGRRLYRFPPTDDFPFGEKAPDHVWALLGGEQTQGAVTGPDGTGRHRLFAFQQLRLPGDSEPYMIFHVAILKAEALAASRYSLLRDLGLLGGAIAAALLIAWLFSGRLLLAPLAKLVRAAGRVGGGELAARSDLPHTPDELGQLANAFDRMATTLEEQTRQLQAAEEDYRNIFEQSLIGIFQSNQEGRFLRVNPAMAEIFGFFSAEEMLAEVDSLGQQLYRDPDQRRRLWETLWREGTVQNQEMEMRKRSGETIWVAISARLIGARGKRPPFVEGSLMDISARKTAEEEIRRSNAELEQFAYAISHDMRQPLRMIGGHLELLAKGLGEKLSDDEALSLHYAKDGARRLDAMIVGLLDYSRVGRKTLPKEPMASREALDEALAFLATTIEESGAEIAINGQWPMVFASRDELTRLLQNLLDNAIKYHRPGQKPEVEVTSATTADNWRLTIRDRGIGIDPGQQDRLFKVFSRLQNRKDYEGSGIGLALCRKIVEHHGGRITVHSSGVDQGSTFVVELPLSAPVTAPA